jgi:hypothetical protein
VFDLIRRYVVAFGGILMSRISIRIVASCATTVKEIAPLVASVHN